MEKLYEGKAKALYSTDHPQEVLVVYSNQATAFNGQKKDQIPGKGQLNNQISSLIFTYLKDQGIANQFIRQVDQDKQLVQKLKMLPVEVVVRNILAGSLAKKVGRPEGQALAQPSLEFYLKNDELGDPFLNNSQILALEILDADQISALSQQALQINQSLINLFDAIGVDLVDFKLEFGLNAEGQLILGDEISPDTCRLWDKENQDKLDKDNFRRDLGSIIPKYQTIYDRLISHLDPHSATSKN